MLLIAARIACRGVLHTDRSGDVAGINHVQIFPVIGVHLQDPSEALTGLLRGVENGGSLRHGTGVDAEEAELANEGIRRDLERQRCKRRGVIGGTEGFLVGVRVDAVDALLIERRRHIVDDRIQKLLHALVLVRGAAGNGDHAHADGGFADGRADLIFRDLFT